MGMKVKNQIILGDSREVLRNLNQEVDLIVTSPPYADARKNHYDSIHPDEYVEWFLTFHEPFFAALKPNGSLVINIKDKVVDGVRHRYVWDTLQALSKKGWYAIDDYVWHKTNPMPGFWPTRLRDGWEYCFHLSRDKRPYINFDAVKRPIGTWSQNRLAKLGKNDTTRHNSENRSGFGRDISKWMEKESVSPSNVLTVPLVGKNMGHPAVFPVELPRFFIKLLSPEGGLVLDPFGGSGTTGIAAFKEKRNFILIDNNEEYCVQAKERLLKDCKLNLSITRSANFKNLSKKLTKKESADLFS
jgi:site-specific DNA-methyltransferase (adenine-specific)